MLRITKKHLWIVVTSMVLIAALVISVPSETEKQTGSVGVNERPIIIIDPGHGGVDGGAVGVGGTVEKDINLQIALRLRDVLSQAGFTVIMTRDTDISIHSSGADTIREKKVSDLKNRLAMTELYPDSILVSIHQNTLDNHLVTGAQVFFSPNDPESQVLAQYIQNEFNSNIQSKDKEIKSAGKNLFLFYYAENTAILAECGFLSNSEEEALLNTQQHQDKIVYSIYSGLMKYLADKS
ncbi:MAG: N-acetylmuramoyl-L-alanine amidase [Clostridia bacterium]|nr:N-acetylmuramoyl-L-alanine amidase [Clostridia bacterium]